MALLKEERKKDRVYIDIPIDRIRPNPYQQRSHFDEEALNELAASIKKVGLLEDIVVRLKDGYYELICGERRWRACKLAGFKAIPSRVEELSDEEAMQIGIIENLQRENLTMVEETLAFKNYLDRGFRQQEIAAKLGTTHKKIAKKLEWLRSSYFIEYQANTIEELKKEIDALKYRGLLGKLRLLFTKRKT